MVMTGVAYVGLDGAGYFHPFSPHVVVVAGLQDAVGIDEFAHAAEVVAGVEELVDRGGGGGDEFTLRVILPQDGRSCGVALFGGLVAAGPEVAFVRGDGADWVSLGHADAAGQAVVDESRRAVVRVSDLDQPVLGVPIVALPSAVGGGVAVEVIDGRAGGAGDVDRVGVDAGRVIVRAEVLGLDGDAVSSGGGRHPARECVRAIGGGVGDTGRAGNELGRRKLRHWRE